MKAFLYIVFAISINAQIIKNDAIPVQNFLSKSASVYLVFTTTKVLESNTKNRINIAYTGDGYTASQLDSFSIDVSNAIKDLTSGSLSDPIPRYKKFFNFYRINLESAQSGISLPQNSISTALNSTGNGDRLATVNIANTTSLFNQAAKNLNTTFHWKYVILNTPLYYGCGYLNGGPAVFSKPYFKEIALHESGHAVFSFLDEYYSGSDTCKNITEPVAVNITLNKAGKWNQWLNYSDQLGLVSVYEGAYHYAYKIYKSSKNSKMATTNTKFNAVCKEKIILDLYRIVRPIDSFADTTKNTFDSLWIKVIDSNIHFVDWYQNGILIKSHCRTLYNYEIHDDTGFIRAHVYDEIVNHAFKNDSLDLVRTNLTLLQQDIDWHLKQKTAIKNNKQITESSFKIYKNTIKFSSNKQNTIIVTNLKGSLVHKVIVNTSTYTFKLPCGIYIIRIGNKKLPLVLD